MGYAVFIAAEKTVSAAANFKKWHRYIAVCREIAVAVFVRWFRYGCK